MHLKKRSGLSPGYGSVIRGAADAVLGTGSDDSDNIFNTKSGILLTTVFLFIIGWIPMVGQAVAGYIGGRRSGSPKRGLVSSVIAVIIAVALLIAIATGIETLCSVTSTTLETQIASFGESYPLLAQLASSGLAYLYALFGNGAGFDLNVWMYAITIPFGILGGVVADQSQKEIRIVSARTAEATAHTHRSVELYRAGCKMGFESYEMYAALSTNTMNRVAPKPAIQTAVTEIKDTSVANILGSRSNGMMTLTSTDSQTVSAAGEVSAGFVTKELNTDNSPFGDIIHTVSRSVPEAKKDDIPFDANEYI